MPRQKRQTYYVIRADPCPRAAPAPQWLTRAGEVTALRTKAARFMTVTEAQDFAHAYGITLDGVRHYIDREAFIVVELRLYPT